MERMKNSSEIQPVIDPAVSQEQEKASQSATSSRTFTSAETIRSDHKQKLTKAMQWEEIKTAKEKISTFDSSKGPGDDGTYPYKKSRSGYINTLPSRKWMKKNVAAGSQFHHLLKELDQLFGS
jgi:hypothetical protein